MSSNFPSDSTFAVDYSPQPSAPPPRLDLVRMLRQNFLLIVGVTLGIAVPACVAVWFLTPIEYRVTGQLLFSATAPSVLGEDDPRAYANYEKWLTSQLDFIEGPTVLTRVAESRVIQALPEVSKAPDAFEYLNGRVTAQANRNSEIVNISARMKTGASAQRVVMETIAQYMDFASNLEANQDNERLQLLMTERGNIETELERQQKAIIEWQRELGIPLQSMPQLGPNEMESTREALTTAQADLVNAESRIKGLTDQLETLESLQERFEANPAAQLWELDIEDQVAADPKVTFYRSQLVNSEAELQQLRKTVREGMPQLTVAERKYATSQSQLAKTEAEVRKQRLISAKSKLQTDLNLAMDAKADAETRVRDFQRQIDAYDTKLADSAGTFAELSAAQAKLADNQARLKTVRDRIDELTIERKAPGRVQPLAAPVIPSSPDFGRRYQLMAMAVLGALVTALGLALLRELLNKQARTAQDLATVTPLPVLASIPHTSTARQLPKSAQPEMLVADHPHTPISEEFRRLLARIVYPSDDTIEVNSCLVTSPTRGDGKTTTACNLALALAQANRRVLLIDVCSRNPQIEAHFGLEAEEGLAEVLYDHIPFQSVVRTTEFRDLMVMGPGLHTAELQGKLASREMMAFLEDAERDFDHIVIDTPPSLLTSDAKMLAHAVDAVVVTVGVGRSTLGMVRRTLSELDQVDANIIGVVLNGIKHTRGGYMAKNFALYDKYAQQTNGHAIEEPLPEMQFEDDGEPPVEAAVVLIPSDTSSEDDSDRDDRND